VNSTPDPRATLKIPRPLHKRLKKFAKNKNMLLNSMVATWLEMCLDQQAIAAAREANKQFK